MIDSVIQAADHDLQGLLDTLPPGFTDRLLQDLTELQTHLIQKVAETKHD
jgi:hypothetical protein